MIALASNPCFSQRRRQAFRSQLELILTGDSGAWVMNLDGEEAVIVLDKRRRELWLTMPVAKLSQVRIHELHELSSQMGERDPRLVVNGRWIWAEFSCSSRGLTSHQLLDHLERMVDVAERCSLGAAPLAPVV